MNDDKKIGLDSAQAALLANAKAKGKRPEYFKDSMAENHFSISMSLVAELAVARERIDTLERILMSKGLLDLEEIEDYIPDAQAAQERQLAQVEYSARIFRAIQQELERLNDTEDKSMDEMAQILGNKDD
ncbi:MAG: hypothetical protein KTR16_00480 [Acidiferrobacterales bacterium]|nr:hypothetical protein [Acidiferrobacterales bacterium]